MEEALSDPNEDPTPALARLYRRWAVGGAALLITGHVVVDRRARARPRDVVIEDDRAMPMLEAWAAAARSKGAEVWMQLNHAGRQTPRFVASEPVAPSAVPAVKLLKSFGRPRALREEEIEDIIARFVRAAAIAERAGFTGVQIHAAHGYLLSQFLSPLTNHRDDTWGGSIENRARMLMRVVRGVRGALKSTTALSVKLNSADFQRGGFDKDDFTAVVRMLDGKGVDLLEISGGNYESPAMARTTRASTQEREAYFLDYARQIRAVTRLPLMLTGGLRTRATMAAVLAARDIDVIGMGRPFSYAPELPARLLAGTADGPPPIDVHSRLRRLDNALQVFWFQEQLHRMARGQEPDLALGRWGAVWRGLRATVLPAGRAPKVVAAAPAVAA